MVFKCQEDSFLKEFETKVVLCEPAKINQKSSTGKDELVSGFNVVLEDTILFPEGGGQPCDHGIMNGKPVVDVQRKGGEAHHFILDAATDPPFVTGDSVKCTVDWQRRHDHMQQHSGQHLVTAIFERDFNIDTISWSLGQDVSYIEFDAKVNVTTEQIAHVERVCNELIAAATPVHVHILGSSDVDAPEEVLRATRGLPKDHVGDIRVITIHGVESNMCCGTHVKHLAQLQCVKILNIEKVKNRQFLNFLIGNRVIKKLQTCFERECELTTILKGGPPSHVELVKKIQASQKSNQRLAASCLKELALSEADKLKKLDPQPKWYSVHRKDGAETEFNGVFLKNIPEIKSGSIGLALIFLTAGEENGTKGNMLLYGDEVVVTDLGSKLCELLDGKGRGKGQRFQAKVNNLKKINECEKIICKYFEEKQ